MPDQPSKQGFVHAILNARRWRRAKSVGIQVLLRIAAACWEAVGSCRAIAAKGCRDEQELCRRFARNCWIRRGRAGRGLLAAVPAQGLLRGRRRGGFPALALLGARWASAGADVLRACDRPLSRRDGAKRSMACTAKGRHRSTPGLNPLQPLPVRPSRLSPATGLRARGRCEAAQRKRGR